MSVFQSELSWHTHQRKNIEKVLSCPGHQNKTQTSKVFEGIDQALVVYAKKNFMNSHEK